MGASGVFTTWSLKNAAKIREAIYQYQVLLSFPRGGVSGPAGLVSGRFLRPTSTPVTASLWTERRPLAMSVACV